MPKFVIERGHYSASLARLRQAQAWAAGAQDVRQAIHAESMAGPVLERITA